MGCAWNKRSGVTFGCSGPKGQSLFCWIRSEGLFVWVYLSPICEYPKLTLRTFLKTVNMTADSLTHGNLHFDLMQSPFFAGKRLSNICQCNRNGPQLCFHCLSPGSVTSVSHGDSSTSPLTCLLLTLFSLLKCVYWQEHHPKVCAALSILPASMADQIPRGDGREGSACWSQLNFLTFYLNVSRLLLLFQTQCVQIHICCSIIMSNVTIAPLTPLTPLTNRRYWTSLNSLLHFCSETVMTAPPLRIWALYHH